MASEVENIPPHSVASNFLGTAARPPAPLRAALRLAARSTGSERAFLVTAAPDSRSAPGIEAVFSDRDDGAVAPSRELIRRAFEGAVASWSASPGRIAAREDGASVRSLGIRRMLSVRVPVGPENDAVLLLDSRRAELPEAFDLEATLGACATLLAALAAEFLARRSAPRGLPLHGLVGRSQPFLAVLDEIERAGPTRLPVLITGETGTGKEGVARAVHAAGPRRSGPFLAVNCAALPESLLDAEIFGVERGAFTGADRKRPGLFRLADGGTLLLDEIGDMTGPLQAKLLRVLQEGAVRPVGGGKEIPVDVRVVAATHRDLRELSARKRFRADLLYRIAVVEIQVPPLRQRLEDLPDLASFLLDRLASSAGLRPGFLGPDALDLLRSHDWPGNVRELESTLARGLLRSGGGALGACHLDLVRARSLAPPPEPPSEAAMIVSALRESEGVIARAAARIGWSRQKLYRRMTRLGIPLAPAGERRRALGAQRPGSGSTSSESSTFQ